MKDKKHKRKKQKDELEEVIALSSKIDSHEKDFQKGTKKLKKKKASEEFVDTDNVEAVEASSFENELKIKKKKKRKRSNSECVVEDAMNIDSEDNRKVKKKKKKHDSEIALLETKDICEIDEPETKKRQKKKKRHKSISPPSDAEEHLEEVPKIKKKKKHKKNKEEEHMNGIQNETDLQNGETEKLESKKKKRKKSKDKDESCGQNDINDTSGNKNPQENGTTLGQWSTASFEDKQRTEKFQRLLGGMKKDVTKPKGKLFGGLVARSGGNNALDKEGQKQLNKNLQAQYDSALSMRQGSVKGIGFGFTPSPGEGKKFYIDTGKSTSMKFNDAD